MADTGNAVVETLGVTKVFRDFWHRAKVSAVVDLDLRIAEHEVFGLLGPNGSGKSTTIKMILGLLYPTGGAIRVFGLPPSDVATKARIGFLPEESYLYPFLNARETLDYYGRLFRQPRAERIKRIDMLLEMVGLSAVASRRVGEYSKGMQRRIGLAQALLNDPDLLILDEPTSGMDPLGARQFKDLIRQLGQRGKTVILSSHLLADVEDVCDRVAILYGGRIRAEGQVSELLRQHGLTQIIAEQLPADTIEGIRRLVAQADRSVLEVTAPRDRLETLFLRIVEQAQSERAATGGAVSTGEVAEFLRGQSEAQAEALVEQLVAAGRGEAERAEAEPEEPAEAPEPPRAVDKTVLEDLTRAKPEPSAEPPRPAQPPKPKVEPDRGLIDSLLNKEQNKQD